MRIPATVEIGKCIEDYNYYNMEMKRNIMSNRSSKSTSSKSKVLGMVLKGLLEAIIESAGLFVRACVRMFVCVFVNVCAYACLCVFESVCVCVLV